MPVARVALACASPTNRPDGTFQTFVAVSEGQLASGEHIRQSCRRAEILGYAGPYRVVQVRLTGCELREDDAGVDAAPESPDELALPAMARRLGAGRATGALAWETERSSERTDAAASDAFQTTTALPGRWRRAGAR